MIKKKQFLKKHWAGWLLLTLGSILDAAGFYFFLAPNQIAAGGINGAALVIHHLFSVIPLGAIVLIFSIFLLLLGFLLVGPVFGGKTIYCSLLIPLVIGACEQLIPLQGPMVEDTLIQLLFGVLISGTGLALLFNQNASTGGTDILARVLKKHYHLNMGQGLLLIDFFITLAAAFIFGLEKGLYALLGIILYTFVIDYLVEGLSTSKQVTIFTTSYAGEVLRNFIVADLERGVTVYKAEGGFTGEPKQVLVTILKRSEFIKLKNYVKAQDPEAFILVQNVHEVFGNGFSTVE